MAYTSLNNLIAQRDRIIEYLNSCDIKTLSRIENYIEDLKCEEEREQARARMNNPLNIASENYTVQRVNLTRTPDGKIVATCGVKPTPYGCD